MKKKICVVTGTRAEYGILKPLLRKIKLDDELQLQLVVTGMHLSPEFGLTYKQIEKDGFYIDDKVEMLLSSDTSVGISKSMGLAMISFSEVLNRLKPDLLVILGDRYEMLSVAATAMVARIPIAHIHGGEKTEGLIDEAIRHSITKMSYLHFTSTEEYKNRVIQLGENPNRVFNVGAMGVEEILNTDFLTKEELEKELDFKLDKKTALVTFHPVTLEENTSKKEFENILDALDYFENLKVIFTKANSDTDGRIINKMIDEYVIKNPKKAKAFTSLGQLKYYSAIKYSDFVLGNSSSGILEVPTFKKPTINIGDRQKGRIQAKTVINCNPQKEEIIKSINIVLSENFKKEVYNVINPYGNGETSNKILVEIKKYFNNTIFQNIKKEFYDLL
ncbi:UDP-N-acetylglucosamine 2-epimerase [Clostridium sp. HCP1S3_B4]|uniref:UDP-N-acetylglucosamine 2-epimerase n=1 Tax=unclassified Clostridium TaxID=2614128 RepID=UPI003F8A7717